MGNLLHKARTSREGHMLLKKEAPEFGKQQNGIQENDSEIDVRNRWLYDKYEASR
jgi:hypothetical protein